MRKRSRPLKKAPNRPIYRCDKLGNASDLALVVRNEFKKEADWPIAIKTKFALDGQTPLEFATHGCANNWSYLNY